MDDAMMASMRFVWKSNGEIGNGFCGIFSKQQWMILLFGTFCWSNWIE
jgi:hypothetical protein